MEIILTSIASIGRDETLVVPASSPCFFPAFPSSILIIEDPFWVPNH